MLFSNISFTTVAYFICQKHNILSAIHDTSDEASFSRYFIHSLIVVEYFIRRFARFGARLKTLSHIRARLPIISIPVKAVILYMNLKLCKYIITALNDYSAPFNPRLTPFAAKSFVLTSPESRSKMVKKSSVKRYFPEENFFSRFTLYLI